MTDDDRTYAEGLAKLGNGNMDQTPKTVSALCVEFKIIKIIEVPSDKASSKIEDQFRETDLILDPC